MSKKRTTASSAQDAPTFKIGEITIRHVKEENLSEDDVSVPKSKHFRPLGMSLVEFHNGTRSSPRRAK